jgi:uncharacterized protein (DUF362 family)/NAD-dependent dihydropyrimidine dehydrogenase PreA subunit
MKKSLVSLVKCKDYIYPRVEEAVRRSIDLIGGLSQFVKNNDKVLLKVNLHSARYPEDAVTTHPSVVKALIRLIKECGGIPIVADSPATFSIRDNSDVTLEKCGIKAVANEEKVDAFQFGRGGFVKKDLEGSRYFKHIFIAKSALEADVIINIPKLKTHITAFFTGAIKNMFGTVPRGIREQVHRLAYPEGFNEAIVDIFAAIRPQLSVMDAVIGMEGNGPNYGGRPRRVKAILASIDSVALDAVASTIIGYCKGEIPTISIAAQKGLGNESFEDIEIVGEDIKEMEVTFSKPISYQAIQSLRLPYIGRLLRKGSILSRYFKEAKVDIKKEICTICGNCEERCPVKAIRIETHPKVDQRRCIKCYCCYELCPEGAVVLKRNKFSKLIRLLKR